jgi:hypothetical protein
LLLHLQSPWSPSCQAHVCWQRLPCSPSLVEILPCSSAMRYGVSRHSRLKHPPRRNSVYAIKLALVLPSLNPRWRLTSARAAERSSPRNGPYFNPVHITTPLRRLNEYCSSPHLLGDPLCSKSSGTMLQACHGSLQICYQFFFFFWKCSWQKTWESSPPFLSNKMLLDSQKCCKSATLSVCY